MEIYKITNNITGEYYIGKNETSNKDYFGSGNWVKNSIKKYGKKNHSKNVIATISSTSMNPKKDLLVVEGAYIRSYYNEEKCKNISRGKSIKNTLELRLNQDEFDLTECKGDSLSSSMSKLEETVDLLSKENTNLKEELNRVNDYLRYYIEKDLQPNKKRLGRGLATLLHMSQVSCNNYKL